MLKMKNGTRTIFRNKAVGDDLPLTQTFVGSQHTLIYILYICIYSELHRGPKVLSSLRLTCNLTTMMDTCDGKGNAEVNREQNRSGSGTLHPFAWVECPQRWETSVFTLPSLNDVI